MTIRREGTSYNGFPDTMERVYTRKISWMCLECGQEVLIRRHVEHREGPPVPVAAGYHCTYSFEYFLECPWCGEEFTRHYITGSKYISERIV